MTTTDLTLVFEENDQQIGVVFYSGEDGLTGNPACLGVVRNRMKRDNLSAEEAIRSLDGWSNGYLRTRLKESS